MPGIVGLLTQKPREWAEPQLLRMLDRIRHESFYEAGVWIDENLGVYVGWTALRKSFADHMPVCNERGDVVLTFSGEEYSGADLRPRLKEQGHAVAAGGPSYLVHQYEEDPCFLADLNGRFHGLLVDKRQGAATLFNDRFGMHPLAYYVTKEGFYFAAEPKALLTVRPELRSIDPRALGELVSCGCSLENRTLFRGVELLPAGSAWKFGNGAVKKETYFHPKEWEQQPPLDSESYYQQIRQTFSQKLDRYFEAQSPVGMSLTGGLDTRMIMAWQQFQPGGLPCYTFGGSYRDCRDVLVARRVAAICDQPHSVIEVGTEFLAKFPHYAERTVYLTDGCADVSRASALYANEQARRTGPVRMTGVYGSEVLRRLRNFKPAAPPQGLFGPDLLSYVQTARDTYAGLLQLHPVSFTVFRNTPQRGVDTLEETQLDVRCPFLDNEIVRTAFRAPDLSVAKNDATANNDVCLRLITDGNPKLGRIPTDRGLGGARNGIWSILSRSFLEFTFKAEYAYDYGMPQPVAQVDHLLSPLHLERLFLGRHKFQHFRVWYRDSLAKYVQEMLLDPRSLARPYVARQGVETMVRSHLKGNRNYTSQIHRLLSLELLHRLFIDA